jgi:hypothetical protein
MKRQKFTDVPDIAGDPPPLKGTSKYGRRYWCIKSKASKNGEIYVMAHRLAVTETGTLIAWGGGRSKHADAPSADKQIPVLMLAAGNWTAAYAADLLDGSAVAVEHWEGEVVR